MRADYHRLDRVALGSFGILAVTALAASCGGSGGPTTPSQPPLPVASESASFRYHYAAGDTVDAAWQETYHEWAVARLGVRLPQKIEYYKYQSRQAMGDRTGNYQTNGFAEPSRFEIHTLWSTDNHEVVHIYTALVGRPSDFFNEGIAVAFQTNPAAGDFESVFNGQQVHSACRQYLQFGTLVVPLERVTTTTAFRAVADSTLSYREAGSFMRFTIDRYGIERASSSFASAAEPTASRSSRSDSRRPSACRSTTSKGSGWRCFDDASQRASATRRLDHADASRERGSRGSSWIGPGRATESTH